MSAKVHTYEAPDADPKQYWFHCPGCQCAHAFTVGGPWKSALESGTARWTFNGDVENPTFHPSLACNRGHAGSECHSMVTAGRIKFFNDCHHALKNQTVDIPEWES